MQTLHPCDSTHRFILVSLWRLQEYLPPILLPLALTESVHSVSSSSTISLPRHFNHLVDETVLIGFLVLISHLLMLKKILLIVERKLLLQTLHRIPVEL